MAYLSVTSSLMVVCVFSRILKPIWDRYLIMMIQPMTEVQGQNSLVKLIFFWHVLFKGLSINVDIFSYDNFHRKRGEGLQKCWSLSWLFVTQNSIRNLVKGVSGHNLCLNQGNERYLWGWGWSVVPLVYLICHEGGGQRVMIGIIIEENVYIYGWVELEVKIFSHIVCAVKHK